MQGFISELENPVVQKDIIDLEKRIRLFREGKIPDEKMRSLRLVRGIYGQRQPGVQMIRIKIPHGRLNTKQFLRICDISDEYASKNLHLTTRQDIQIHYVSLDRTPELYAKLSQDDLTLREACGNTVRNVTASQIAGIDPKEPFDVTPYAYATTHYFLRNPICQDMGRKFKISFSSSDEDTAFSFIHDVGFIPKIRIENGKEVRGFKVLVGGGLGAQPFHAYLAHEFLPTDQIIPFTEGVIRVFDRYGERTSRNKARLKYLIAKVGFEEMLRLVEEERLSLKTKSYPISGESEEPIIPAAKPIPAYEIKNVEKYQAWLKTNVFEQKQKDFFAAYVRVPLGDIDTNRARILGTIAGNFAGDDFRVTINQGLLFKYIRLEAIPYIYSVLESIDLGEAGHDTTADIAACPGTDTCNLGISSSTGASKAFEEVINNEYPELVYNTDIKIKISGCMNACAQHNMVSIGFHGSSVKHPQGVLPALQVLLGGGPLGDGKGKFSDKIIKVPSRRGPDVLRALLDDYEDNANGELYSEYYSQKGKDYFYQLLKPFADLTTVQPSDFIDFDHEEKYKTAIGVGECAGVVIDLIATLFFDVDEKLEWSEDNFKQGNYADSIYQSYTSLILTAKALLLDRSINCNTHIGIINDFQKHFVESGDFIGETDFKSKVLAINKNEPTREFAESYLQQAKDFLEKARNSRNDKVQPTVKVTV